VFRWFKKSPPQQPLQVDIHSHLLPELDDGAKSLADAEEMVRSFVSLGYKKLITTPHVMSDAYRNTPATIHAKLQQLRSHLLSKGISITVDAAAEYYLDEAFTAMVEQDQPLLTFGDKYLLFETNFLTEPFQLKEFIFKATTKGYKLVLAHPERYMYLQDSMAKAEDLISRGVFFQLNISSLTGYYSKPAQRAAFKFIDHGWVHLLGSDCHHMQHTELIRQSLSSRYFQKALDLPLLNNTLL